jgi:hypothetical protein
MIYLENERKADRQEEEQKNIKQAVVEKQKNSQKKTDMEKKHNLFNKYICTIGRTCCMSTIFPSTKCRVLWSHVQTHFDK